MYATYLKDIKKTASVQIMSLTDIFNQIRSSESLHSDTQGLRLPYMLSVSATDEDKKREYKTSYVTLKNQLSNVIFAGEFTRRSSDSCTLYWANIVLDIDNIKSDKDKVKIKEYFKNDLSTVLIFVSPSGMGLKVVQNVNYNDEEKIKFHKAAFSYLKKIHDVHLKKYGVEIDPSGSDITRTCFLCYDEKAYFNENPMPKAIEFKEIQPERIAKTFNEYYLPISENAMENVPLIEDIINFCSVNNIDLTSGYTNWLNIMWALKNTFADDGLNYFIELSKNYQNFNIEEATKKWNANKVDPSKPKITLGTVVFIAQRFGYRLNRNIQTKPVLWNNLIEELYSQQIFLRFEDDSRRLQIMKGQRWDVFTDVDEAIIRLKIFKSRVSKLDIIDFLYAITPKVSAHKEFLKSLPDWDKVDRFGPLSETLITKDEDDIQAKLKHIFVSKWIVGAIAGLHNDGRNNLKNENILVLAGPQYVGKTRWCNKLLPNDWQEYFLTKNIDLKDKDDVILLANKFIIFMDEGVSLTKNDVKAMKAASSMDKFNARKPYGRHNEDYVRYTSFIAATNDDQILSDDTGNRRYWVIKTDSIIFDHNIDMKQVWAQALHLYRNGFQYWITQEEYNLINQHNKAFEIENPVEIYIERFYQKSESQKTTATEIYEYIADQFQHNKHALPQIFNPYIIGRTLKKLGYKKKNFREGKETKYYWLCGHKGVDDDVKLDNVNSYTKLFDVN